MSLHDSLRLEPSADTTRSTRARAGVAHSLGYELAAHHADDKLDRRGQRQVTGLLAPRVPGAAIAETCPLHLRKGKPAQRAPTPDDRAYTMVGRYQAAYRGLVQDPLLAQDVVRLGRPRWVMATSLLKTLAGQHRSRGQEVARRHQATTETPGGPRTCGRVIVPRGADKEALVAQSGGISGGGSGRRTGNGTSPDSLPYSRCAGQKAGPPNWA